MQAVVTLAGEGTRMLPWSRGLRKEFLPLYDRGVSNGPVLKPVAHFVVEALASAGADRISIVVQPRDAAFIQTYFSVDHAFLHRHRATPDRLLETREFYRTLDQVQFSFVSQPSAAGFGDAVLRSEVAVGRSPFFLHAGDGIVLERHRGAALRAMGGLREKEDLDAVLLVRHVEDARKYGVIEGVAERPVGPYRRLRVTAMVEKPPRPKTHWAATAVYAFGSGLYPALSAFQREERPHELELTDGIRRMLANGGRVAALALSPRTGTWRSVGSPEGYARALVQTRRMALQTPPRQAND
jgi:UTP--glucose-1-phosphate uridylyltransferase